MSALPEVPALERAPVDWVRHKGDGRPKILPPPGVTWRNPATNRKIGHKFYTRVTTYADAITESYNLTAWKLRRALKGAANRRDYVLRAASLSLEDRDRDEFDALVELVLEAAGESASLLGTTLHSLTESLDRGEDLGAPPEEVLPDLAAYTALTQGLIAYVHREARVVCDQLETAGTPDGHAHIAEPCPAGCGPEVVHIIDTKTGSIRYPGKMSTQLAIYSRSDLYDPASGARTPVEVCQKWGAIIHLPVETGEAAPFWLDLEHGWRGAELCGPVRTWHRVKADDILRPFETVQPVRVVDGEVTRFEPRLASWNPKSPTERAPDPADITDALEATVDLGAAMERVESRVEAEHVCSSMTCGFCKRDKPAPVAGAEQLADAMGATPEQAEALVETATELGRCAQLDLTRDPGARQCERPAGHPGACGFASTPTPVERCVHELRVGECAMPACRPDLAHLDDSGVEPDEGPTEVHLVDVGLGPHFPVALPAGDDADLEQLASGPDSDATDEPEPDPIAEAIRGCITTRDLELLSSTAWRTWGPEHRALAGELHDQLEQREQAAKPRAAFEAAVASATSVLTVESAVAAAEGQPWLDDELLELAGRRWRELRSVPA